MEYQSSQEPVYRMTALHTAAETKARSLHEELSGCPLPHPEVGDSPPADHSLQSSRDSAALTALASKGEGEHR